MIMIYYFNKKQETPTCAKNCQQKGRDKDTLRHTFDPTTRRIPDAFVEISYFTAILHILC